MKDNALITFFEDYFFPKFALHLIPGLFIYFGVARAVGLRMSEGIFPLFIVLICSWTLGYVFEYVFFNASFSKRSEGDLSKKELANLLLGKIGISMLLMYALCFYELAIYDTNYNYEDKVAYDWMRRTGRHLPLIVLAVFLFIRYRKRLKG